MLLGGGVSQTGTSGSSSRTSSMCKKVAPACDAEKRQGMYSHARESAVEKPAETGRSLHCTAIATRPMAKHQLKA